MRKFAATPIATYNARTIKLPSPNAYSRGLNPNDPTTHKFIAPIKTSIKEKYAETFIGKVFAYRL
ncbi:MAG: hypothetical protein PUH93_06950 [Clostridia bacterium]|nr:hypothetical protein [Clostridia bacterium]